jgi:hypothetical protein
MFAAVFLPDSSTQISIKERIPQAVGRVVENATAADRINGTEVEGKADEHLASSG